MDLRCSRWTQPVHTLSASAPVSGCGSSAACPTRSTATPPASPCSRLSRRTKPYPSWCWKYLDLLRSDQLGQERVELFLIKQINYDIMAHQMTFNVDKTI